MLGKSPERKSERKLVFILHEHGKALTKESQHKLVSELFDKALNTQEKQGKQNIEAVIVSGPSINDCAVLWMQIKGRDIAGWEMVYIHGSQYPPVLLSCEDKVKLVEMLYKLADAGIKSPKLVYEMLAELGAYKRFGPF